MKQKAIDTGQNVVNNIIKVKMQIIINKELYNEKTIDFDTYKMVENKLIEKLNKLEEFYSY